MSIQLNAMGTQKTVMEALGNTSKIMGQVNENMNIGEISQMLKTFEKEKMKAEMNSEIMTDAMDMGEQNEEADEVYNQILGEIGMSVEGQGSVGTGAIASNK